MENKFGSCCRSVKRFSCYSEAWHKLNPAQCAVGLRVATILRRLAAQDDKFESLMSDVYNRCDNELGLTPERICSYITNLAELSGSVPIS